MSNRGLPNIPSLQRQQLFIEFARFKAECPEGIYISLTPGDPTLWSGVLFVRKGPYSPSLLRFVISFPPNYPERAPLIIFSTDIFHPLIVPLTTYTFSTGSAENEPVSASDEDRLPPGGFSLRHGFPLWFGQRAGRSSSLSTSNHESPSSSVAGTEGESSTGSLDESPSPSPRPPQTPTTPRARPPPAAPQLVEPFTTSLSSAISYIISSFTETELLDSLPLGAAGNPSAWHAWRSHRKLGPNPKQISGSSPASADSRTLGSANRQPGEWNWEGVWEKRVKAGLENSLSDQTLFGGDARRADEMIRFVNMDQEDLDGVREVVKARASIHQHSV